MQYLCTGSAVSGRMDSLDNATSYNSQGSDRSLKDVNEADNEASATNINPPEVPTCCCMSGCPNCVYLQYANEMADYIKDNGSAALKAIDAVEDESLKTFLKIEVEHMLLKQNAKK